MVRRSLPISSRDPGPLYAQRTTLDRRWARLSQSIADVLRLRRGEVQIEPEYSAEQVAVGLVGRACERAYRERGGAVNVAPLTKLRRGLSAWLGLQEVWEVSVRDGREFAFRHLSLTVHFGFAGDLLKPQILRSEWYGIRDWTGGGPGFQSPGAGHPHWQFDISATFRAASREMVDLEFLGDEKVEDFEPEARELDVWAMLRSATFERMHFASAAPWWMRPTPGANPLHMNAPADEAGLSRWLLTCIAYLKQELARCEIQLS